MIEVKYKQQLNDFILDVNFEMPEKGITILFGPSGSGKTSVLNLIAGLADSQSIQQASLTLNNKIIDDFVTKIYVKPWLRNVAYVFQDHRLFSHLNVKENILFGYKRRNSHIDSEDIIDDLIKAFSIGDLLAQYPAQLSGGQKQRVAMVRALLSQPQLLILDEPLAALDYSAKQQLLPYIEKIQKEFNIPIIYVSHDIKEVLRLADYIVLMEKGKVIAQGDIADLCITQPLLTQQEGASFILNGKVSKIITEDKLVQIDCGETILVVAENMQLKQNVRILIHARDVSLCLTPPKDSSILNCIKVCIDDLQSDEDGKLRVLATLGGQRMIALISRRSARLLEIEKGKKIYAQFKASAMIK